MTRWTILLLSTLFLLLGQQSSGQTPTFDTTQNIREKNHFIKSAGLNFAIGNVSSTTGWIGFSVAVSSKYFEALGGWGVNNVRKYNLGLCFHLDLKKQFCPFISTECVFSTKRGFVFNEGTADALR